MILPAITLFAGLSASATVSPWPLPAGTPSSQPQLATRGDTVFLSWIEPRGEGHVLRHAADAGTGFGEGRDIAAGERWFVNWADFPALAALPDGGLAAHVLVKRSAAPYAYDVHLVRSRDGVEWSTPRRVHDDGAETEHGFAALWPAGSGVGIAWLDGRATAGGGHGGHHGGGAMTLRAARFVDEAKTDEQVIDASTCDCCQTDVALAARGPVLVYRDRTGDEIRDIAIVRHRDGHWTEPAVVHADGWKMPACPVNGPAVAARGDEIVVAWYTAAGGEPEIRLARSRDDGAHFDAPITVARGTQVQGRVDLASDDSQVVLAWIDEDDAGQTLRLARFTPALQERERVDAARLARGRGTGFPRIALRDGAVLAAWTDVVDRQPRVQGATIRFDQ